MSVLVVDACTFAIAPLVVVPIDSEFCINSLNVLSNVVKKLVVVAFVILALSE
jgi:hypothetical protein